MNARTIALVGFEATVFAAGIAAILSLLWM